MRHWQTERKEKLADLVISTHVIAYLVIAAIFLMHEAKVFSFENIIISFSLVFIAAIFILLDYYLLQLGSQKNTMLVWNIIKHAALFLLITFVFSSYHGKYLNLLGILYLLPVALACITLGRRWGLVFAGVASGTILALSWTFFDSAWDQSFEIILAYGSVFFLLAWFLSGTIEVENRTTRQLVEMVNYDELTGLANHRYFQEKLQFMVEGALAGGRPLSLILLDIDYFKRYNNAYGHAQGDLILQELGNLLAKNVPPQGFLARYGGEEFAVLLPDTGIKYAIDIADKLRLAVTNHEFKGEISQPFEKLTLSAGVANLPDHAEGKQQLLEAVDEALYSGKFTGRNRVRTYLAVLERLSQAVGDKEIVFFNNLKAYMTMVNVKDRYTYGHSERVAYYAKLVGERLGMAADELRMLEYGAFLHDVGKLEVPRGVLNKKGPLTKEEWEYIIQHPKWGVDILIPAKPMQPVIPMVLHHHENYDGSGYPDGLQGEIIPLAARILRVIDSFDAITTHRPYRSPLSRSEALKEISQGCGQFYDPQVAGTFSEVIRELGKDYFTQEICD